MGDVCFSFVVMMFYFFRWMKMNMIIFLMEAEMVEMAMLVMLVLREMAMASTSVDGLSLRRWTVGRWSHACMGGRRSSAKKNHLKHSTSLLSLRRNTCITGPALNSWCCSVLRDCPNFLQTIEPKNPLNRTFLVPNMF